MYRFRFSASVSTLAAYGGLDTLWCGPCGGIFSDSIITNFLLILTVNDFKNWLIFDVVEAYKKFLGPPSIVVSFRSRIVSTIVSYHLTYRMISVVEYLLIYNQMSSVCLIQR